MEVTAELELKELVEELLLDITLEELKELEPAEEETLSELV